MSQTLTKKHVYDGENPREVLQKNFELFDAPPESHNQNITEWAKQNFVFSAPSPYAGQKFTHRVPAARKLYDSVDDGWTTKLVGLCPVQTCKSTFIDILVGYKSSKLQHSVGVFYPDEFTRDKYAERVGNMLRKCKDENVAQAFLRKGAILTRKLIDGNEVHFLNAGSESASKGLTLGTAIADEWRLFTADVEGDMDDRTSINKDTSLLVFVSSAGDFSQCRTTADFALGTAHVWQVPCPRCNYMQELNWNTGVSWSNDDSRTARYTCVKCDHKMDSEALHDIQFDGEYLQTNKRPVHGVTSIKFNALAATFSKNNLNNLVDVYLKAHAKATRDGNYNPMKTFFQSRMCTHYDISSTRLIPEQVRKAHQSNDRVNIDVVPDWVDIITMAVDLQQDRFECEIVGWGLEPLEYEHNAPSANKKFIQYGLFQQGNIHYVPKRFGIAYFIVPVPPNRAEGWETIRNIVNTWKFSFQTLDMKVGISCCAIDIGDGNQLAAHVAFFGSAEFKFVPIRGVKNTADQIISETGYNTKFFKESGRIHYNVGTHACKEWTLTTLGDGVASRENRKFIYAKNGDIDHPYNNFIENAGVRGYTERYFHNLTVSERLVVKRGRDGRDSRGWEKASGIPNEPLDLAVYNFAMLKQMLEHAWKNHIKLEKLRNNSKNPKKRLDTKL